MKVNIDQVEAFWDNRPCNIRHSSELIGSKKYFDEVEQKRYKVEPHIKEFVDFQKWKGKSVLEVGCGIGTEAINFLRNSSTYVGTDLSKESLNITKKRLEVFGFNAHLFQGNAEELTKYLPKKTYDLIYSFGVIHHSPNPKRILSEIKYFMNPDSELRIMLYAKNSWKNFMIEAELDQPEAQYGCPIANTYSKDEVKKLLSGFEILSIQQKHIFPYQIEPYKNGKLIKQPWFECMPKKVFDTLQNNLGWHLLIRAKKGF